MPNNQQPIIGDSKERVAFDLMKVISDAERASKINEVLQNPRGYYLGLFNQCNEVVYGSPPESVLDK